MKKFELKYVCEQFALEESVIISWMGSDILSPCEPEGPAFDEEDLARIRLILELKETYNSNDESIELILHLIDQIHHLSSQLEKGS